MLTPTRTAANAARLHNIVWLLLLRRGYHRAAEATETCLCALCVSVVISSTALLEVHPMPRQVTSLAFCALLVCASSAVAQQRSPVQAPPDVKPTSITLEDVPYPHPVHFMPLTLYGQDVRMAYMDVPPAAAPNGHTV